MLKFGIIRLLTENMTFLTGRAIIQNLAYVSSQLPAQSYRVGSNKHLLLGSKMNDNLSLHKRSNDQKPIKTPKSMITNLRTPKREGPKGKKAEGLEVSREKTIELSKPARSGESIASGI
jgi:hypothetical protein